jgi:hypothetical protein
VAIGQYILDKDGNPQLEPDLLTWAIWLEFAHLSPGKDNRIVGRDFAGKVRVSTVFLGLDYQYPPGGGEPVLWETMIFGGDHDSYQRRYTSRADAEAGHYEALALVNRADIAELDRILAISGGWEKR